MTASFSPASEPRRYVSEQFALTIRAFKLTQGLKHSEEWAWGSSKTAHVTTPQGDRGVWAGLDSLGWPYVGITAPIVANAEQDPGGYARYQASMEHPWCLQLTPSADSIPRLVWRRTIEDAASPQAEPLRETVDVIARAAVEKLARVAAAKAHVTWLDGAQDVALVEDNVTFSARDADVLITRQTPEGGTIRIKASQIYEPTSEVKVSIGAAAASDWVPLSRPEQVRAVFPLLRDAAKLMPSPPAPAQQTPQPPQVRPRPGSDPSAKRMRLGC